MRFITYGISLAITVTPVQSLHSLDCQFLEFQCIELRLPSPWLAQSFLTIFVVTCQGIVWLACL
jgi:hypothetical protein